MNILDKDSRYDSIIIWGHGLSHLEDILTMIREKDAFDIVRIIKHKPTSMKKFVRKVYSYDYAPLAHLKSKIKYLEKVEPSLVCIVINNSSPAVDILGKSSFRHKESLTLKQLKTEIRERFNPYKDGEMTHDHIIHATDNEEQTYHILNAIGDISIERYYQSNLYTVPFFLGQQFSYEIKELPFENLLCGQAKGDADAFIIKQVPVQHSVQYKALCNEVDEYRTYINKYLGTALKADHSVNNYLSLKENFNYLSTEYASSFVTVKKLSDGKYLIMDGLHRAALHLSQNFEKIKVCIIK
ncbi:hypothetical protein MUS1_03080 [Marinomonas ushuaiensis DSM 15871]|uniref:Uncharacterized protein n=1 Tax=Marinomonas ushuaiensis DSM 15871 TaxID=1122207 RepID=X7EBT7_9GAMM|nr:hypothetical protein [Marinomonas ushuaiensis]ETX12583.1 hypothetical protein MUS1_03080 [Marinomonas ushuaiensis DSM 15871]